MNDHTFLNSNEFPNTDFVQIDPSLYDGIRYIFKEATFLIFTRKESRLGIERIQNAIQQAWPKWTSYFDIKMPPVSIVETEWGLGGGSLGPFMLAIHLKGNYDEASAKYLESILGWPAQSTGLAYINKQFANFEDPLQTYITDQVVHELGHIFFLHGVTDLKNEVDIWFGLGLGLVYDRLIWKEISEIPSPIFDAFHRVWREKFATNVAIDQRLINPCTEKDNEFGLVRLQVYGHAKACAYLSELRLRVGHSKFDAYVRSYLSRPIGSSIEYEDFLSRFSTDDLRIVHQLESEFVVR